MRCIVCNAYKVRKVITLKSDTMKYYCNKCESVWEIDSKSSQIVKIWKLESFMKGE